jgi:hypothetical protein
VSNVPEGKKFTPENAAKMGAKGGKNKAGKKHISTHIQEMLNDENFELKLKDGSILKGRPMDAIIKTAIAKGVSGDMRAFDMLGKYGYGTKLDVTSDGNPINVMIEDSYARKPKFRADNKTSETS